VLALLDHLERPVRLRESAVGDKPEGVTEYSASEQIPLLVHGDLVLTESRVMLEHLAEFHGFEGAFPAELSARTLHRHGMAVVDCVIAPLLFRKLDESEEARLDETITALDTIARAAPVEPSLFAFHVGPIWLRFRWWQPQGPVTRAFETRPRLRDWLDAATQLDALRRTAPNRAAHIAQAQQAGLL